MGDKGFTLVELLIVIALIAILATIGVSIYFNAVYKTAKVRVGADFYAIALNTDSTRRAQRVTLQAITGSFCSICSFCDSGVDVRSNACINQMRQQYQTITKEVLPFDPWDNPYLIDENDEDPSLGPGCFADKLYSAGPDHILQWGAANSDDLVHKLTPLRCTDILN